MRILPAVLLVVALLVAACGGDGGDESPSPTASVPASGATEPGGTVPAGNGSPAPQQGMPEQVRLERVFPNLTFANLTGLYQTPSGAWLATEQVGRIRLINAAGTEASTFLDITSKVNMGGSEEGLLGLALAPDFGSSGVFYVYYSAANPRRSILSRFASSGTQANPGSERVLLEVEQPFSNHNGGQIAFGPDGFLYVALGDGGSRLDPQRNAQNLNALLGKILRIDVSGGGAYRIPPDNPFVGQANARAEVWAYGLRNPWRFSFDRQTGELWAGDVGQNTREEVDIIKKGANYGWVIMEGFECTGGGNNCDRTGKELPVIDYPTSSGNCAVTGGFVYRGNAFRELQGAYVYGDYCSGRIWALRWNGNSVTEQAQVADANFPVSSFAQGNDGELYALQYSDRGGVYRLVK